MPPAPLVTPSTLRPIVLHIVFAAGLVMGLSVLGWVIGPDTLAWLAASVATACMVRATAALGTRSRVDPSRGCTHTLGWSLVMGIVNTSAAFLAVCLVTKPLLVVASIPIAGVAMIIGAPLGMTLGMSFGVVLCIPVALLMRARQHPSDDATDVTLLGVGLWLAAVALLCGSTGSAHVRPIYHFWSSPGSGPLPVLTTTASLCIALGSLLALAATSRMAARRRWLAAVTRGEIAGWRVAPPVDPRDESVALPCLGGSPTDCDHLLYRYEDPGQGAYRHAETRWPVAWVPRSWVPEPINALRE